MSLIKHFPINFQAWVWCRLSPSKIEAIKKLRLSSSMTLKDSKMAIDKHWPTKNWVDQRGAVSGGDIVGGNLIKASRACPACGTPTTPQTQEKDT